MNGSLLYVGNLRAPEGGASGVLIERDQGIRRVRHVGALPARALPPDTTRLDGGGGVLIPALTDMGGFPDRFRRRESLRAEQAEAVACGYGSLVELNPPEGAAGMNEMLRRSEGGQGRLIPIAALPHARGEMASLVEAGAVALSDGGAAVEDSALLYDLMREAASLSLPLILSSACPGWTGQARAGRCARYFSLAPLPDAAFELAVMRILLLAERSGCRVHLSCLTTAGELAAVRAAKARGVAVSCGVSPFHAALSEDALFLSGSAAKLSPPLPDEAGREAILAALADGTVDCLASYHLPCRRWEKQVPPEQAVAGAPSYRTALGVGLRWLVGTGVLSLPRLIAMMSEIPASLLGRESGLAVGGEAAFAVLGDGEEWTVGEGGNEAELLSPFSGQTLRGRIIHRFFDGRWS